MTLGDTKEVVAVDIGNSFTKMGLFLGGQLKSVDQIPTPNLLSDANQAAFLQDCQSLIKQLTENTLHQAIISSVVPAMTPICAKACNAHGVESTELLIIERDHYATLKMAPISIEKYQKNQLGPDRLANLIGVQQLFPNKRLMVVDIGTTITFDLLNDEGVYLGGAIAPGPHLFESLLTSRHVALAGDKTITVFQKPAQVPGLSTETSIANGLYNGFKGMVVEIITSMLYSAHWSSSTTTIVITGGAADALNRLLIVEFHHNHVVANLTLTGLYQLWTLNQSSALKR